MKPLILFKDVHVAFGRLKVLRGLSLDIYPEETLTIIGGSGSGKSVMLKLLLGILTPDKGEILFQGRSVPNMREKDLISMRKQFGVLFQGSALFDSLTVRDNIAYPINEHYDYSESQIDRMVAERLELVGLEGVEKMMPSDLSGGMKKRVGLARAIATDPTVILYDEPTTGLDPTNTQRINRLITQLQAKMKITSIVVTHDMESAFKISSRMALLKEGQICFVGTIPEIKASKDQSVRQFIEGKIGELAGLEPVEGL